MDIEVFVTPGLGDNSFVIVSGDEAAVIDPQRDAARFLQAADDRSARIRAVFETHVHNDYVSGAHEIRSAHGAELVLPADGGYGFDHRGAREGEEVRVGDLRIVAMDTPGHTFEHIAWLVYEGDNDIPTAVFSGGSLLVGSAGRTDLLGPAHTDELTAAQYRSVQRLKELPADTQLLPTHGAGSFCVSSMPSTSRISTVGAELKGNDLALADSAEEFTEELTGELMAYPAYYAYMAPANRAGAPVLDGVPEIPGMDVAAVKAAVAEGATVIDARERDDFAAAHIPGSLNIELNSGFGSYIGWILDYKSPIVLLLPDQEDAAAEAMTQLIRIGWDNPIGAFTGGMRAWTDAGEPTRSYPNVAAEAMCDAMTEAEGADGALRILDVRQPLEWQWGTLPGSQTIFVSDLPKQLDEVPAGDPIWLLCSNGHRAAIAASLLDGADRSVVLVGQGGVGEVRQRCSARQTAGKG